MNQVREVDEGKQMIESAKRVGVKLLLISSEPSITKASNGRLTKVVHFDSKAEISDYARQAGVKFVEIYASAYMNNLTSFVKPRPAGDGTYIWDGTWSETTSLPLIDTYHDFGLFVRLAIESEEFNPGDGKVISAYSEWVSVADQARILSEVTGKVVRYNRITDEQLRSSLARAGLPPHAIDDMVDMFHFHEEYWAKTYVHSNRNGLARQPRTFREYCEAEDWSTVLN